MGVPERQELRVGDRERQAVVDQLRTHFGAGRLELDEFEDRTARALAARIVADLVPLTADLPAVGRTTQKGPPIRQPDRQPARGWDLAWRIHRNVWLAVSGFLTLLWLLVDFGGTFWPGIVFLAVGLTVAIHGAVKKAAEG